MKPRARQHAGSPRWLVLALLLAAATAQAGPPRQVDLPSGAQLVYRTNPASAHLYAPVVLLPYTGGSGQDLYRWKYRQFFDRHSGSEIAFILPPERGRFADYRTGKDWSETVIKWEAAIQAIVDEAADRMPLDRERVVLAGFSMGGDMAWAMMQRQPDRYAGAIIMGSRCNWRERDSPQKMAERAVRVVFLVGDKEREARRKGAQLARGLLEKFGVPVRWQDIPGGHQPAPGRVFAEQIDFVLNRLPAVAQAAGKPAVAAGPAP